MLLSTGPILLVIATRPDGIKIAPVYRALRELAIPVVICSTDQHTNLLQDVVELFEITPDVSLNVMKPGQDLFYLTAHTLQSLKSAYESLRPSLVLVQGDTTSALVGALAAFYLGIPVGHIEAGLRTGNIHFPFPEELNRRIISLIATYHFAPTQLAVDNLVAEGIKPFAIFNTGNTVVDALYYMQDKIASGALSPSPFIKETIQHAREKNYKICLLTAHRRESFGQGLQSIFTAIKKSLQRYPNLFVIYPAHPNPAIRKAIDTVEFEETDRLRIMPALSYVDLVHVLANTDLVATDSGGIQEEAISLGKPVLVLRKETERMEAVCAQQATLVGTDEESIIQHIGILINQDRCQATQTIYGDGTAAKQIAQIIKQVV